ncbi:unnamed protein product [Brachionus calyciflorus]|uniref:WDR36/Utp21 N-terminal domain-containing protein n=1 Tax=Brachionus calyciflorus TaxID=104777 RepID=A0A814AAV1_9BILA|nr:unnamed protein product [Brachionus calyciflorus]
MKVWNIETTEVYLTLNFAKESFKVTTMLHPITYLNKMLFGSTQGSMQLWNIKTSQLIHTFKCFNSPISVLKQAPAIDVAGIGLENSRIILHNLKFDETIMSFV